MLAIEKAPPDATISKMRGSHWQEGSAVDHHESMRVFLSGANERSSYLSRTFKELGG